MLLARRTHTHETQKTVRALRTGGNFECRDDDPIDVKVPTQMPSARPTDPAQPSPIRGDAAAAHADLPTWHKPHARTHSHTRSHSLRNVHSDTRPYIDTSAHTHAYNDHTRPPVLAIERFERSHLTRSSLYELTPSIQSSSCVWCSGQVCIF